MSPAPPPAQEPSNPNGEPTSPPAQWLWDFPGGTDATSTWCEADKVTEVKVVEYWGYEDGDAVRRVEDCAQDEIVERLKKTIPLRGSALPSIGLQIALVYYESGIMPPLGVSLLNEINEALGLPNYHHHFSSMVTGAVGIFLLPDNNWFFVRQRQRSPFSSSVATVFRYNPQTNTTRGVVYGNLEFPVMGLISEFELCPHPLLLALLALEVTFDMDVTQLTAEKSTMLEMEQATGHGLGLDDDEEFDALDYRTMVKALSNARGSVYMLSATLRVTHSCATYILKKLPFVDDKFSPAVRDSLRDASRRLQERAEYTTNAIEHALENGVKERLDGLHGTLFNLITQNDSLLSTSIARDLRAIAAASKRDSSSMKIIAVLTTFFLPGTFIATFFSMPFFDWNTESIMHAANKHFWIFWAVTAPLTVTTMAGVAGWALWHSQNTRNMDLKERQNFNQVVADEAQKLKRAATMRTAGSSHSIV